MHTLAKLKREFLHHLEHERGRSDKTLENYDRYLTRFFVCTKAKKVSDLTAEHVRKFRLYLARQHGMKSGNRAQRMKPQTQNYHLIALRAFLRFLREQHIKALLPEQIELTKTKRPVVPTITATEWKRILQMPAVTTLEGRRDKVILELLFSAGLRLSELCALSITDVDFSSGEMQVHERRGSQRTVWLKSATVAVLQEYVHQRDDTHEALFVRYGRKMHDGGDRRISPRAVERLVAQYAVQAGITHQVTPEIIRHTFANLSFKPESIHQQ